MKSSILNPQKYFSPDQLTEDLTPEQLEATLRRYGCNGCELGLQPNILPVVYRGNPQSKLMIIGEAPGLAEAQTGLPFCGPAGQLLDKMLAYVGWDSNKDWFISNVCLCRPVAPEGSGKENLTPKTEHMNICRPYINHLIKVIKPSIIVLMGMSAAKSLIPDVIGKRKATELAGTLLSSPNYLDQLFYFMYHPAYLLRKMNMEGGQALKDQVVEHLKQLKEIIEEQS